MGTNDLEMTFVAMGSGNQGGGAMVRAEEVVDVLPEAQQKTMEMLVAGRSIADAARITGVSRTTIYRWLNGDRAFMEVYEMWQRQRRKNCRSRLVMLTDKATDVLERLLEEGNATASIQLLKGVGMLGGKRRNGKSGREGVAEVLR